MSYNDLNWNIFKYFAYAFFVICLYYSYNAYHAANIKILAQLSINRNVSQVKQTWNALQPSVAEWQNTYKHNDSVIDLVSLNANLNISATGLSPVDDFLVEGNSSVIVFEGTDIGLAQRCLKNNSGGYALKAKSISAFLKGIDAIDERIDLNWNKLLISTDNKGSFKIMYAEMCQRYRLGV